MAEKEIAKEKDKPTEATASAEAAEPKAEDAAPESQAAQEPQSTSPAEKPAEAEKAAESAKPAEPDWKALYAVTLADFDNYKKRAARDREDVYRYAESDILKDVLPAIDNLQLALAAAKAVDAAAKPADAPADSADAANPPSQPEKENSAYASFVKGVQLVYETLLKALKDHGAEPFDSVGKELDTEKMEAIATLPSPDVEEGKVSIESKKGWMLRDKVLRVAQVVVSSGKPA